MKFLVVCPLSEELHFLTQYFRSQGWSEETQKLGQLTVQVFPESGVMVACGGHGKTQSALQTQHLLDHGQPFNGVICAGAAGAIAPGLAVGDIVVAETTIEHDYNLKFVQRPRPQFAGSAHLLSQLRDISSRLYPFGVHYGTMASGDEDVVESERGRELHQQTGAIAVAWEGAGVARACRFSRTPFLEIRGITDTADHSAPGDFEAHLEVAMSNLGRFLQALQDVS